MYFVQAEKGGKAWLVSYPESGPIVFYTIEKAAAWIKDNPKPGVKYYKIKIGMTYFDDVPVKK